MELKKAIQDRNEALENSRIRGRIELLLKPGSKRIQIFSGTTREDPTNCLFAEIYYPSEVESRDLRYAKVAIELIPKRGHDKTYKSFAKQAAEFITSFWDDFTDLPIAIYSSIKNYHSNRPATVYKLPPLVRA